jgi:hypothetical protein
MGSTEAVPAPALKLRRARPATLPGPADAGPEVEFTEV